jgi:hypothetical protein
MYSKIRVKLYYGDHIRRFTITNETKFDELMKTIEAFCPKKFEGKVPVFQYLDDEQDYVRFSTEAEWKEALTYHDVSQVLRLKIKEKKDEKKKEKVPVPKPKKSAIPGIANVQLAKGGKKWEFETKEGDYVVELNSDQISDFLLGKGISLETEEVSQEDVVHHHVICDSCGQCDIKGIRYHCKQCQDFDLCQKCFKVEPISHFNGSHHFEEVTKSVYTKTFQNIVTHIIDEDKGTVETIESKVEEPVKEEPVVIVKEEPAPVVEEPVIVKVEKVQPVFVQEVKPQEVKVEKVEILEKYSVHYQILENMGFSNKELSTFLLNKYKGNLQKVVDEYLTLQ